MSTQKIDVSVPMVKNDSKDISYLAPKLRRLGSVKELTFGTSNKIGEPGNMRNM